ncbi:MAG: hypothetical protein IJA69_01855 [Clostridia bacterium]|nr:hypothetical protein [Clostridia bacterium]
MKCEKCGSVANSFCTIEENGQRREIYLCSLCRKKILDAQQQKKPIDISKDVFCHNCGVTLKDFMESGYVGCESCYEQFGAMMHKAIVGYQKNIENLGKIPPRFARREKLNELNKLLEKALFNNDLEQVNRISREIKALGGGR